MIPGQSIKNKRIVACSILLVGIGLLVNASYIQLKAQLAQVLMASAYAKHSLNSGTQAQKPWPWADTHVIAKLEIQGKSEYVLSNASMRNLAFGPAHMPQTAPLGSQGNSVIVGHRDTHFSRLQNVKVGEIISLHQPHKQTRYKIEEIIVVHQTQMDVTAQLQQSALTLITCYPFNGLDPNPQQRFVVRAIELANKT
jgi:sortase A